jgi:hypothetical protein
MDLHLSATLSIWRGIVSTSGVVSRSSLSYEFEYAAYLAAIPNADLWA